MGVASVLSSILRSSAERNAKFHQLKRGLPRMMELILLLNGKTPIGGATNVTGFLAFPAEDLRGMGVFTI